VLRDLKDLRDRRVWVQQQ
jgi:hypothetical protein